MDDEPVSARFEDCHTYLSNAPARLAQSSAATTEINGVSTVNDTLIPLATVADVERSIALSDARHEREVSPMVRSRGAGSVAISAPTSVQPSFGHVTLGRRGSSGRRMPGMVRKSLQEQELRELLEASKQASFGSREQAAEARAHTHRRGVGVSDSMVHASVAASAEPRASTGSSLSTRSCAGLTSRVVLDDSGGGEDGCASLRGTCVEHSAPSGRSQTNSNALKRPCPEGGGRDGAREEQSLSRYAQAGAAAAAAVALGTTASSAISPPTATSTGSPDPETHPILELYRSSREPLDQLTFFELKRRIESAVLEDGAGPASMAKLIEYLRSSKRFGEDQIARLEALYGRRARSEGGDAQVFVNDGEAVDESGVEESFLEDDGETRDEVGGGKERDRGSPVADDLRHCPCRHSTAGSPPASAAPPVPGSLSQVVLKFTTVADGSEAPSFAVGREGATVGRGSSNDISIPTDSCMGDSNHASIVWKEGAFHVQDRGYPYGASIRIGTGKGLREWPLDQGSVFSAGNSVFLTKEIDEMGMLLEIVAGPLKGERRRVQREGATVGRATENTISIADRELSRHHSTLECDASSRHHSKDEARGLGPRSRGHSGRSGPDSGVGDRARVEGGVGRMEFYLCDVGSTNGTYVQLVGPYAGSRRLELSDHILIGRTGFSINRFDWGVWEDRGARRAMEDKSVVIQDMGVESLAALGLGPQTFLGVYDGHGGAEASAFLWQRLHINVAEALEEAAPRVAAALEEDCKAERRDAEQEKLLASTGGAPADREDIVEPSETGAVRGDADVVAPGVDTGRGGPGGGAVRVESDGGEDEDEDGGDFDVKKLDFVDARCSSPTGVVSSGDTGRRPSSPTCDAASPPALADGVGNGGGQACGSEKAAGAQGHLPADRSDKDGSVETGGSGWKETREVRCTGRGQPFATVGCEGVDGEWRWGSRRTRDSTGMTSCIPRDPSGTGDCPGASALPESLCESTATADVDSRTGDAGTLHAPMEGREGGGVNGELAAGGEAARGVQTERDGAGGAQGGGALERTDGSSPEAAVSGCSRTSDSVRGDGLTRCNGGRDSPTPVARGRSGVQSPGGEPSRSLATAGLPAEGEGGAGASKLQGSGSNSPTRPGQPMTAMDRVMEEVVCQAFLDTDEDFLTSANMPSCGSTATTVMILGDQLYSFNVGDSRTLICRGGRVMLETRDHKPDCEDEMERIKKAGGIVIHKRVMGELAVSRAFGDKAFKMGIKAILREEHEVQQLELEDEDEFGLELDYEDDMEGMLEVEGDGDFGEYDEMDKEMEHPAIGMEEYDTVVDGGGAASGLNISAFSSSRGPGIPKLLPPAEAAPLPPPPPPPLEDAPVAVPKVETPSARARVTDPTDALIIARPEMWSCRLTPEDEFVLLACDGLFDVFTSEEVVDIVREEMRKHGDTQRVCETLTRKAIDERYTRDNVSVVLVVLKKFW